MTFTEVPKPAPTATGNRLQNDRDGTRINVTDIASPNAAQAVHASHRNAPVICAGCGRKVQRRARQQRFCSARCKEKGRKRVRRAFLGRDAGAPLHPRKKDSKFKGLQRAKTLSSWRILAPADVLAVEVLGRAWNPTISSGGVSIEIGRLRPRTLVGAS
jgi:hypothetical protein